jgi:glycerate kinase
LKKIINILIAPDKMKGTLTAFEICEIFESVAEDNAFQNARGEEIAFHCASQPLADGGDGSLEVLWDTLKLKKVLVNVHGPLMKPLPSHYAVDENANAFIEMAAAAGLVQVPEDKRNCMYTTSFGFGELIKHAVLNGAKTIYLFLGGSATCDAGMGMASALGYQFLDKNGKTVRPFGGEMKNVTQIKDSNFSDLIENTTFITLCDVDNPILGPNGAAPVFAPQKGANNEEVAILEDGIANIVDLLKSKKALYSKMQPEKQELNYLDKLPGGGAAGGMGLATHFYLGAQLISGTEQIMRLTQFADCLQQQDAVITAEGQIDASTLHGKVPYGVCKASKKQQIPCYVLGGAVKLTDTQKHDLGAKTYYSLSKLVGQKEALTNAKASLKKAAKTILKDIASAYNFKS